VTSLEIEDTKKSIDGGRVMLCRWMAGELCCIDGWQESYVVSMDGRRVRDCAVL